ncbi:MAG: Crp/Fnr family transcriptional regulator [Treponema sp.]|nr:Crp/Fnr family transcriptional regulator [Treponema sp.]
MKKKYPDNCILFAGIDESDIRALLDCLSARQRRFKKNSFIFDAGDKIESIGIVLSGAVHVLREDFWGKRKIVARLEGGGLFGEAFACAGTEEIPVSVMAAEDTEVLFVNSGRIIRSCQSACAYHTALIKNLILLLAEKNIALIQKLECITQPTTREKLLTYLSEQAHLAAKNSFSIPFNREELADYLSVERSAMSAELSKMKNDGLILYKKNHFELLKGALAPYDCL